MVAIPSLASKATAQETRKIRNSLGILTDHVPVNWLCLITLLSISVIRQAYRLGANTSGYNQAFSDNTLRLIDEYWHSQCCESQGVTPSGGPT